VIPQHLPAQCVTELELELWAMYLEEQQAENQPN
jgi:hypothetical protein